MNSSTDIAFFIYVIFMFVYIWFLESIKLMYEYGPSEGDSVVATGYSGRCLAIALNDDGILIFHKRHYKLYVSTI